MRKRKKNPFVPSYMLAHHEEPDGSVTIETYGLSESRFPEVMIDCVRPPFLSEAAGTLVRDVAEYLLHGARRVQVGETILLGASTIVRVEQAEPREDGSPRWRLAPVSDVFCPECEGADHEPWRERIQEAAADQN